MLNGWFSGHIFAKTVIDFADLKDNWLCCPDFVSQLFCVVGCFESCLTLFRSEQLRTFIKNVEK